MPGPDAALVAAPLALTLHAAAQPDPLIGALGAVWERTLTAAVDSWQRTVEPVRLAAAERAVEHAVHSADPAALAILHLPDSGGAQVISVAMRTMEAHGAASVVAEADRAGLTLPMPPITASVQFAEWARAAADLLAAAAAVGFGREALRLWRPGQAAGEISAGVRAYAGKLTDRSLRDVIGGALTRAQNIGRLAAYAQRPPLWDLHLVADETLDSGTCPPCRRIDGTELPTPEAAALAYGGAGYLFCEGGERCRGTVRGEWTPRGGDRSDALWPLGAILAGRHYKRDRKGRFSETDEQRLASVVKAAKALGDDSEHWHRLTGGGSGSGVRMATLPDGRRVVRKQAPDWGSDEPRTQADAEYLGSLTGGALDVPIALAQHDDDGPSAWIEHHGGPVLPSPGTETTPEEKATAAAYAVWRESKAAIRMGLFDTITGNNDRNEGNLIFTDDEVIGIDHANSYEMLGYEKGRPHPQDLGRMGGAHAPAQHFIHRDDDGRNTWVKSNPMTPGDVIETRQRLEALRPKYDKMGRSAWLDNALLMLGQLGEHAGGTESIYD